MRRGEVYWYDSGPRAKRRPVVVLTLEDGLPRPCVINLHQVHTVERSALGACLTQLAPSLMRKVEIALSFSLGFGEHPDD